MAGVESFDARTGHPFRLREVADGFAAEVGGDRTGFLADHRVFGRSVFPATAYLELALATRVGEECDAVESLEIPQALDLAASRELTVTLEQSPAGGLVIESSAGDERSVNATATVRARGGGPPRSFELSTLRESCPTPLSVEDHYQRCRQMGIDYGPRLRAVRSLSRGKSRVFGELSLPAGAGQLEDFRLHPVLSDGLFQLLFAAIEVDDGFAFLPVAIEGLRLWGDATTGRYGLAEVEPGSDSSELRATLTLLDQSGAVIALLRGVRLKKVPANGLFATVEDDELDRGVLLATLAALGPADRRAALAADILREVGELLELEPGASVDSGLGFFDLGLGSLSSVVLRNRLQTRLDLALPATLILDYPTVDGLVDHLSALAFPTAPIEPAPAPAPAVEDDDDLDQLSSEELADLLAMELDAID